jgi:DNA-binding transcriptional LysR family regulator
VARRHPLISAEVLSLSTDVILARLRAYELDAGIIYVDSGREADLATLPLWQENHVLLTARAGPFEGRETVTWREAAKIPLCRVDAAGPARFRADDGGHPGAAGGGEGRRDQPGAADTLTACHRASASRVSATS